MLEAVVDLKKIFEEPPDDGERPTHLQLPVLPRTKPANEQLRLVIVNENLLNTHLLPRSGAVTIGRAPEAQIYVPHPTVSRAHAKLHVGESLLLEDLGSANGTAVNNVRVAAGRATPVAPSDTIRIGQVLMVLQREGGSSLADDGDGTVKVVARPSPAASATALSLAGSKIIVRTEAMQRIFSLAGRVAKTNVSVLVLGETGVGKEIVAHAIHRRSPRREAPFLSLNCAALAEPLLESELFGHEKGAFTGAHEAKIGLFEKACGGTVFLDEIGDMSLAIQAKLLRAFEERTVLRLGAVAPRPIDVRFVTATNKNLGEEVAAGRFRKDFYFRLSGVTIQVPPLRERTAEIEPLAHLFIEGFSAQTERRAAPELSAEALDVLLRHPWPGNVRELKNVIERAVLLADEGLIRPEHLDLSGLETVTAHAPAPAALEHTRVIPRAVAAPTHKEEMQSLERARIAEALERCGGNQTRAAELLGIPRRTFVRKLKLLGLQRPSDLDRAEAPDVS